MRPLNKIYEKTSYMQRDVKNDETVQIKKHFVIV